jgi:alkanesulfonate monooxygenase SsuD/methylene tetrahydromethanopterin reductase-like flavin-dependent oxidoreductase (luciferase family)
MDGYDVVPTVPLSVGDDVEACAEPVRGYAALYVGGMGSREKNFYNGIARRMGFEAEARRVQDLFLERRYAEAAAAVPLEFVDRTSLLGPPERIADRLVELAEAGVTTVTAAPYGATPEARLESLRVLVGAVERAGLA